MKLNLGTPARYEAERKEIVRAFMVRMQEGYGEHVKGTCTAAISYQDGRRWYCGRSSAHRGRHSAMVLEKRVYW